MTRTRGFLVFVALGLAFTLGGLVVRSAPSTVQSVLPTAFTYQGRLVDGKAPTNGSYPLTFRLFDALTGGVQIGSSVVLPNVPIVDGLFTVQLDFGSTAFTGSARYLEVQVATTVLSPRQSLTATPYAFYASRAGQANSALTASSVPWSGITGALWDLRGNYTLDFSCVAQCVAGTNPHAMTINTMDLTTGEFSGTGVFLTNTAYTWIVTGTLKGNQLTMNVVYNALNVGYTVEARATIAPDGTIWGIGKSSTDETWTVFSTAGAAHKP